MVKKRIQRVAITATLLVLSGFLYAGLVALFHRGIPCILHQLTRLKCPGCGMTHAMMALLKLDFTSFIEANLFAPIILAFLLLTFFRTSLHYIQTGHYRLSAGSSKIEVTFLFLFLAWGIIRNIIGI